MAIRKTIGGEAIPAQAPRGGCHCADGKALVIVNLQLFALGIAGQIRNFHVHVGGGAIQFELGAVAAIDTPSGHKCGAISVIKTRDGHPKNEFGGAHIVGVIVEDARGRAIPKRGASIRQVANVRAFGQAGAAHGSSRLDQGA